jgi:hypothetical protein
MKGEERVNTRCNVESTIRKLMKMKRERGKPIINVVLLFFYLVLDMLGSEGGRWSFNL